MQLKLSVVAGAVDIDWIAVFEAPGSGGQWQLEWSDDFDGNSVDQLKWRIAQDCDGGGSPLHRKPTCSVIAGNSKLQCYTETMRPLSLAKSKIS